MTERRRRQRYWDKRRSEHPAYVERNREQTRERMRRLRAERKAAEQIRRDPVGYLDALTPGRAEMFATQESLGAICRRAGGPRPTMFATQESFRDLSVGLWVYLRARALFATREGLAPVQAVGV